MAFLNLGSDHTLSNSSGVSELNHLLNSPFFTDGTELRLTVPYVVILKVKNKKQPI